MKKYPIKLRFDITVNIFFFLYTGSNSSESLWDEHIQMLNEFNQSRQDFENDDQPDELHSFLRSGLANIERDPIKLGIEMAPTYLRLSKVALKYLCVTATSVPSERLFSKTRNTLTEKRNRLKGQQLSEQLFLNSVDRSYW